MKTIAAQASLIALIFSVFAALASVPVVAGGIEPAAFANDAQRQSYDDAIRSLRCMVCQNQTLAESDAPLARDMRAAAQQLAKDGKSADDIAGYIAERYGDFAVYRPPFDGRTAFLWLAPFLVAALALCFLPLLWRRNNHQQAAE